MLHEPDDDAGWPLVPWLPELPLGGVGAELDEELPVPVFPVAVFPVAVLVDEVDCAAVAAPEVKVVARVMPEARPAVSRPADTHSLGLVRTESMMVMGVLFSFRAGMVPTLIRTACRSDLLVPAVPAQSSLWIP